MGLKYLFIAETQHFRKLEFEFSKMLRLAKILTLFRKFNLLSKELGLERRKGEVVLNSFLQLKSGLKGIFKAAFEFALAKGAYPSHGLVNSITPIGFWQLKKLFAVGLMKLHIFDLKTVSVSEFQMFESNLFRSLVVDGKYEFLKNWCFTLTWGILCTFLGLYWQLDCRIIGICSYMF